MKAETHLKLGQKAPVFKLQNQDGAWRTLADFTGKPLIIFFYGLDGSPSCTNQACAVQDAYEQIKSKGYEVIGVSRDSVKKHANFSKKHQFPYQILADPETKTMKDYGVYGPKLFFGKIVQGVYRNTFILDEKGIIKHIIKKVVTKKHGDEILDIIG